MALNYQTTLVKELDERSLELITVSLLLTFTLGGLDSDLLVILLEGSQILTSLGELTLLHTLTDVPVDEGTLGVHQVELVVDAAEDLSNRGGVADHAHSAHNLGQVTTRNNGGGLVVDAALEPGGGPVDELDGTLRLDGGHGGVHVLRDNITTVHHAARHVLSVAGVALDHHARRLEHGVGDLGHGELFVVGLLRGDDRSVRRQHKVDTRVRHQVGLELRDIDVQGTVEPQGRRQRRYDLGDQTVQVGVGRALDVQVAAADVVQRLVVDLVGHIGVLQQGVDAQHGVVGLDNGGGHLRATPHSEGDLGLLTVVHGQALQHQATQTGSRTTTDSVVDHESLETGTVVSQLTDAVQAQIDDLLTDGVVTTSEVVS